MPNLPINQTITHFYNTYSMIFGRKTPTFEGEEQWKGEKCLSTMRQSFHRALTTCKAPLPPGKKYVGVQFLNKELIFYVVDTKGKGQEIFDEASKHLGLTDTELFGLAFYQDGDYIFIDLGLKLSKYAVRSWKTHTNGIGGDGQPLLILHMRVQYYVDCHLLINEKIVRHHYYLQLRENVKSYLQPLSEEKSFILAALALQADLGNFNAERHKDRYFEITNYFPSWIIQRIGEDFIIKSIPALHKDNSGLSRGEAQVGYIKEASDSTAPHNLHLYKMRRKKGKSWSFIWLGICDSGINLYEQEPECTKSLLSTFLWCDIANLQFEKKKFEILSEGSPDYRRFTYFVQSEELAKNLFWICRMTHMFHIATKSRVAELKKLELDGGKSYREAYIYTDAQDQAQEKRNTLQKSTSKSSTSNSPTTKNGTSQSSDLENNLKSVNTKMPVPVWNNNIEDSQYVSSHHSMESLPLANGSRLTSELKYKSQSIPCLPDRSLTPYTITVDDSCTTNLWCAPTSTTTATPSTLLSRNGYTSNTDSNCSSLSLLSSSTLKVDNSTTSQTSNDNNNWVKCDSFEELSVEDTTPQKVCISTFVNKTVKTANVYNAVTTQKPSIPRPNLISRMLPTSGIVGHAASSLDIPTTCQIVDVRRTPSFNVCPSNRPTVLSHHLNYNSFYPSFHPEQTPIKPLPSNAQHPTPSHGRTATRIGVSSLNREQRLPLTLFDDRRILGCGSEPNLYIPIKDRSPPAVVSAPPITALKSRLLLRNLNSRSEMCLNVANANYPQRGVFSPNNSASDQCDARNRQLSLPDVCSDSLEGEADFPCIPPPPAYRNEKIATENSPTHRNVFQFPPTLNAQESQYLPNNITTQSPDHHKTLQNPQPPPPDVLDIQQLRQQSRELELPLLTALCNDRSLLMLPKTVPTCSRQRHLMNKDPLRFNRTTSLPDGDGLDAVLVNSGRPISWHVESRRVPHWPEVPKPCSSSWDYSIQSHVQNFEHHRPHMLGIDTAPRPHINLGEVVGTSTPVAILPPTILTSFGKMPIKPPRYSRDQSSASDSYRYDKSQMLPMKLLAGSLGNLPNGRLYQKGLSS